MGNICPSLKNTFIKSNDRKEEKEALNDQIFPPDPMSSSASIYGKEGKPIKTVVIQESPLQNPQMNQYKSFSKNNISSLKPFVIFPNIENSDELVAGPTSNNFFDAFFLAYVLHGEIVLSPDDIWLQINSCFAQYVNQHSEKLRDKIVTFQNKKDLIVLYDEKDPYFQDFRNSKYFRWDGVCKNFSELIHQNTIEGIGDLIECNFSCTGAIEKAASQVSLMHSCEKYFNYRMGMDITCGIQKVHFLGEKQDWENLKTKLLKLKNYNLEPEKIFSFWIDCLSDVIENFIKTYSGDPNVSFWNSIIQQFEGYEGIDRGCGNISYTHSNFINGWILNFFLFNKDEDYFLFSLVDRPLEKPDDSYDSWKKKTDVEKKMEFKKGTTFDCFPSGIWKAPVLIEYCYGPRKGKKIPVNFIGGFSGVIQEGCVYRPQISFAVGDRNITDEEKTFKPLWKKFGF